MTTQQHLSQEELVAYAFGDSIQPASTAQHLEHCAECVADLANLRAVLNAIDDTMLPVPQRENYGEQVWASVKPRLERSDAGLMAWLRPQRLVWAAGLVAIVLIAFFAGRLTNTPSQPPVVANHNQPQPERLARAAVADHLERSQMMLVELANADAGKNGLDISAEQDRARDLLQANRLYRQNAKRAGDPAVRAVLDELERVLVEIANSPSELSQQRLAELQQQIQDDGILFKVRVMNSNVRNNRQREAATKNDSAQRRL